MTQKNNMTGELMISEPEPSADEVDAWRRNGVFLPTDEVNAESYPRLKNMSAGFLFRAVVHPIQPARAEYVAIPMLDDLTIAGVVGQWNLLWESAQFRRRFFDEDELPGQLRKIADLGDVNVSLVPRTKSRYFEYAPLLHLLPQATMERFGLPLLRTTTWPYLANWSGVDQYLPDDFEQRLARAWAWAWTTWPHLVSGSPMTAFSKDDPIRLLSHNLDFWLPPVTEVIQTTLRGFPQVDKGVVVGPVPLSDGGFLEGAVSSNPRMGGDIWTGEDEAAKIVSQTIEAADATGQLRGILDAVRSNRVEDDFSERWSFAREDFERKMYKKRSKTRVRFVELTDTIPVQGPESEILGAMVTNEFLTVLDTKNRQIVVLLNSGVTKKIEIAKLLGYANHSPVSKRLRQIQKAAAQYFADS